MAADSYAYRRRLSRSGNLNALNAAHQVVVGDAACVVIGVLSVNTPNLVLSVNGRLSDDGPWMQLRLRSLNDTTANTPVLTTGAITALPVSGWWVDTQGLSDIQVIVSAYTAGSVVVATGLSDETKA